MNDPRPILPDGRNVRLFRRHWTWLESQPRGIDASLRRLVEQASRDPDGYYRAAAIRETCYLYMRDMAGDRPHFEDAVRALFANDSTRLQQQMASWPHPIREQVTALLDALPNGAT